MVAKLDPLGRDAQDIGATIKLLAAREIEVVVVQLGKMNLTSAPGKMVLAVLAVLAAMAEMEFDLLVERTQSGLARAKAEGRTLGRPINTAARDQAKIVELHAAGQSLSQIAVQFKVGKATVHAVVKAARTAAQAPAPTMPAKPAGKRATANRRAPRDRAGNGMVDDRAALEVSGAGSRALQRIQQLL